MRAASTLRHSDERCPDCRGGLVCAEQWEHWLSRRDDAEASWLAEHGALDAFDSSPELAELLDDRPACEEEVECVSCAGTGFRPRPAAHRRYHAA